MGVHVYACVNRERHIEMCVRLYMCLCVVGSV